MANTKLRLNNDKVRQQLTDALSLSGTTTVFGNIRYSPGHAPITGSNSLVTVSYATGLTTNVLAGNGLTRQGQVIKLGGLVTGATQILSGLGGSFYFGDTGSTAYMEIAPNNVNISGSDGIGQVSFGIPALFLSQLALLYGNTFAQINSSGSSFQTVGGGGYSVMYNNGNEVVLEKNTSARITSLRQVSTGLTITTTRSGFTGSQIFRVVHTGITLQTTGSTRTQIVLFKDNGNGLEYGGNYSSTFNDRSLVDKGWVLSQVSGITVSGGSTFAANGLKKVGGFVVLGGGDEARLTGDTYIYSVTDGEATNYGIGGIYFGNENAPIPETINNFRILLPSTTADTQNAFWITTYDGNNETLDADLLFNGSSFSVSINNSLYPARRIQLLQNGAEIGYGTHEFSLHELGSTLNISSGVTFNITNGGKHTAIFSKNSLRIPTGNTTTESGTTTNGQIWYNVQTGKFRARQNGVTINLAGTGTTGGVDTTLFNGYTAATSTNINNRLLTSVFNSYTGTTDGRINTITTNFVSGATNLGSGSSLFSTKTSNRLNFRSLSGGTNVMLSATTNNIIVNALTGSDPELDYVDVNHFMFGGVNVTSGIVCGNWYVTSNGTGAGISTDNTYVDSTERAMGVAAISCGTTSTGRARMNLGGSSVLFGQGHTLELTFRALVGNLSTTADTYTTIIGFCDTSTAAAQVDGAYFRYTNGVNGGRWECVNENNGNEQATDSGVSPTAGVFDVFKIIVNGAGTSVQYYINGTLVQTNTSQIPTGSGRHTSVGMGIWKSVGANERVLFVDYYKLKMSRTTSM